MTCFEVRQMAGNKPVGRIGAGAVQAAVWENEIEVNGTTRTVLKVTLDRRYKDKSGNWKSSQSFSRNEIPLAILCLSKAFDLLCKSPQEQAEELDSVPI